MLSTLIKVQVAHTIFLGKHYSAGNVLLVNQFLTVTHGDKKWKVRTNEKAEFRIEIQWTIACPSKITEEERIRITNSMNPKYIEIEFDGTVIKIKNWWKKYTEQFGEKDNNTWNKNLLFD